MTNPGMGASSLAEKTPPRAGPARTPARHGSGLETRYARYREREVAGFLSVIPREGVRPLYREALRWAARTDRAMPDKEPMAVLVAYLGENLPLPPFEVWLRDLRSHPEAHAEAAWRAEPSPDGPVTVAVRPLHGEDGVWYAALEIESNGADWKGAISFHREGQESRYRTARIFVENSPTAVKERFLGFDEVTLAAFLRSVRP